MVAVVVARQEWGGFCPSCVVVMAIMYVIENPFDRPSGVALIVRARACERRRGR